MHIRNLVQNKNSCMWWKEIIFKFPIPFIITNKTSKESSVLHVQKMFLNFPNSLENACVRAYF